MKRSTNGSRSSRHAHPHTRAHGLWGPKKKGTVNQLGLQSGDGRQETHGDLTGISHVEISTISFTLSWHKKSVGQHDAATVEQPWASGHHPPESKFEAGSCPIAGRRSTSGDSFEFHRLPRPRKFINSMSGKQRRETQRGIQVKKTAAPSPPTGGGKMSPPTIRGRSKGTQLKIGNINANECCHLHKRECSRMS